MPHSTQDAVSHKGCAHAIYYTRVVNCPSQASYYTRVVNKECARLRHPVLCVLYEKYSIDPEGPFDDGPQLMPGMVTVRERLRCPLYAQTQHSTSICIIRPTQSPTGKVLRTFNTCSCPVDITICSSNFSLCMVQCTGVMNVVSCSNGVPQYSILEKLLHACSNFQMIGIWVAPIHILMSGSPERFCIALLPYPMCSTN